MRWDVLGKTLESFTLHEGRVDGIFSVPLWKFPHMFAYRGDRPGNDTSYATITPGVKPSTVVDTNDAHASHCHGHEGPLRGMAKHIEITLEGRLLPCQGCSYLKELSTPIVSSSTTRAVEVGGRLLHTCLGLREWYSPKGGSAIYRK